MRDASGPKAVEQGVLDSAGVIFLKTDAMSHIMYNRAKRAASERGVPLLYLPDGNAVGRMEEAMAEALEALDAKTGEQ